MRFPAALAATVTALCMAAPGMASVVDINATPGAVSSATQVSATASLPAAGATAGSAQEVTQVFDPTFLRLGDPSQVIAPEGWTTTFSTDGIVFGAPPTTAAGWAAVRAVRSSGAATGTAATGGTQSTSIAAPDSAPFPVTSGGDGWDVFFDDRGHVFNIWHHNGSPFGGYDPRLECHTRSGTSCGTGWNTDPNRLGTFSLSGLNTGMQSPGWVDTAANHIWFPTNDNGSGTGFACVDISTIASPSWCGGSAANAFRNIGSGAGGPGGFPGDSLCNTTYRFSCVVGLAVAGSRIYTVEARTGKVLCLDMAANGGTGAACAGQPYTVAGMGAAPWQVALQTTPGLWLPALMNVNGRIIGTGRGSYSVSTSPVTMFCLAGETGEPCTGWSTPKTIGDASDGATTPWLTYAEPSASGAINGVCARAVTRTSASAPECFTLDGATMVGNAAITATFRQPTGNENGSGAAVTSGSRVYWGNGTYNDVESRLHCSDAATNTDCAGWPVVTETAAGAANRDNYAVVLDPLNDNCLWVNSDSSGIYQYNSGGTPGCAGIAPSSATFSASSLVTTQRLSCAMGPAWGTLSLTSPSTGTYSSASLTVLDARGNTVVSAGRTWRNVPIGPDGSLSLADLAQADTGPNPQFVVTLVGRTGGAPFSPIATTITTPSYPPQLCATLTPQEVACPFTTAPAGSLQGWASPIAASGTQGATQLTSTQAEVTFASPATAACAPAPPSPPATPSATTSPPPPAVTSPRMPPAGTAILTSVRVSVPGTVVQRGTRVAGGLACTSRPATVGQPGVIRVACVLNRRALSRLRSGPLRIRLVTTLRTESGGSSSSARTILLRARTVPVTG